MLRPERVSAGFPADQAARAHLRVAFVSQPRDAIAAAGGQCGSVAIVTWELARHLADRHEITIYAPRAAGQEREERSAENIVVRRVPYLLRRLHRTLDLASGLLNVRPPYFASDVFFREYAAGIARLLTRDPPDIIHVQSFAQFVPVLRRAAPRAAIVLHVHDETLTRLDPAPLARRLATTQAIVTCSEYLTERWRARFPALAPKIHTVGNGVDLGRFHPGVGAERAADRPELLYVGRVSPEKGVHVLARAFERVLAAVPDAHLSIVGPAGLLPFSLIGLLCDDPFVAGLRPFYGHSLPDRVRKQILEARTGYVEAIRSQLSPVHRDSVSFPGQLDYAELPALYRRATLVVVPSLCAEPFGLPVAEAMASGVPVIASRSGGLAGLVENGRTGWLVERGDASALADAILSLLGDPLRLAGMRRAARSAAEARFGWKSAAGRLDELYQSLNGAT